MRIILIVFILLFSNSIAFSQDTEEDHNINCKNPTTQLEMNICANRSSQSAEDILNATYNAALQSMKKFDGIIDDAVPADATTTEEIKKETAVTLLEEAQNLWIDFRNTTCDSEGFLLNGTMKSQVIDSCLERMATERTKYLESTFSAY